ncbi:MAG: hypothetical protein RL180_1236 [Pseudomonadota bacterium]|jgi:hypothetical protein
MTKNSVFSTTLLLAACALTPVLLTGCGGGSDTTTSQTTPSQMQTLNGVAATGKPFVGKVVAVNAQGDVSAPVDIAVDGSFSVTLPAGAPYLIKAYSADAAATLYSYAASASVDGQINITQLTTAAVLNATANVNLETLFNNWAKRPAIVNDEAMLKAATQVVFNLNSEMIRLGLTTEQINTLNVFTVSFSPVAGDVFDLLLDNVSVDVSCGVLVCNASYKLLGQTLVWSSVVDPTKFNLSFNVNTALGLPVILLGNYTRTLTTTILGQDTVLTAQRVGKPLSKIGFCYSNYLKNTLAVTGTILQCDFNGKIGTFSGTTAAGASYSSRVVYSGSTVVIGL